VDPSSPSPCYNLAALHARNQEAEQAIGWLNKAFDRGFHDCRLLKTDADFQGLRGKPTFEALMTHQCR